MELFGDKWNRLIKGEVRFIVSEGFPALFLQQCRKNGVCLRYVQIGTDTLEASASGAAFKSAMTLASNLGMRVEILSKRGIPQFLFRYRHRFGIPVGLLLFAVLLSVMSSFVWSVEVEGIDAMDYETFSDFLQENHIRQGMFLCNVDTNGIEDLVESYDPHIKKSEANLVGSRLIIRVIERESLLERRQENEYGDLIAQRGGEIIDADITAGVKKIREGDAVVAGDILAEGLIPLNDGTFRQTRAQGSVIARTHRQLSCMSAQTPEMYVVQKWSVLHGLCFFGCEFPLNGNKGSMSQNEHVTESVFYLRSGDHAFPLGIRKTGRLQFVFRTVPLTQDQTLLLCATDLALQFCEKLERINVVSFTEKESNKGTFTLECDYVCEENIALFQVAEEKENAED